MTVHIREFVLRLGVGGDEKRSGHEESAGVTQEDLNELYRDVMRELRQLSGETRTQPFDR